MATLNHVDVREAVRQRYGAIAETRGTDSSDTVTSCCGDIPASALDAKAHGLGYSAEETSAAPAGANLGLGCGNPIAIASLRPPLASPPLSTCEARDVFPWTKHLCPLR